MHMAYRILFSIHYTLCIIQYAWYTLGVAKNFRFTCTLFWSIPTYSKTLARTKKVELKKIGHRNINTGTTLHLKTLIKRFKI